MFSKVYFRIFCSCALIGLLALNLSGCAMLYHVSLNEVDGKILQHKSEKFEIIVSEIGLNIYEANKIVKTLSKTFSKNKDYYADFLSIFYCGPQTGSMTFDEKYADIIASSLYRQCPSGNFSSLMAIREQASYPIISGGFVKIIGYCFKG